MTARLIVIGADAAGMTAAAHARQRRRDLDIVVFDRGDWANASPCGIPFVIGGELDGLAALATRTPSEFRNEQHIDVRLHHEVLDIDLVARRLAVRDHAHGRDLQLGFDELMLSTGARRRRPDLAGAELPFVHGAQNLADAQRLMAYAHEVRATRVVVVGATAEALTLAEAFLRWGAQVTLVGAAPGPLDGLAPDLAGDLKAALVVHGITVLDATDVHGFEPGMVHTDAGALLADLVVLSDGVEADAELGTSAGVRCGASGAFAVDRRQRTSIAGVWAGGDCAESFHRVSRRMVHAPTATVANRQGRVAGINLGGGYATFGGVVGTAVTQVCSTEVATTGLDERAADAAGIRCVAVTVDSPAVAPYLVADTRPVRVHLVAEQGTGRLVGAQLLGGDGVAKRIDAAATMIGAGLTVEEVVDLDLSYAPRINPVWDPIAAAASVLADRL